MTTTDGIASALREARLAAGLSQQQLAAKLGLGQRQISDLERTAVDTRLSTLQNVARALDLELVLVPRKTLPVVEQLLHGGDAGQPMYVLLDDTDD